MNNELALRVQNTNFQLTATDSAHIGSSVSYGYAEPTRGGLSLLNLVMVILVLIAIICSVVMFIRRKSWKFTGKFLLISTGSYLTGLFFAFIFSYVLSYLFTTTSVNSYYRTYVNFTPDWVIALILISFVFMPFVSGHFFLKKFFGSFSKVHLFCASTLPFVYLFIVFYLLLSYVFY